MDLNLPWMMSFRDMGPPADFPKGNEYDLVGNTDVTAMVGMDLPGPGRANGAVRIYTATDSARNFWVFAPALLTILAAQPGK